MTLRTRRPRSIGQVRAFVEGNESVDYEHQDRGGAYAFVAELKLTKVGYTADAPPDVHPADVRLRQSRSSTSRAIP